MYDDSSNIIRVGFEGRDLLGRIVIVDSQLEVI